MIYGIFFKGIYTRFNIDHPKNFKGHSFSMSDMAEPFFNSNMLFLRKCNAASGVREDQRGGAICDKQKEQ